MKRTKEEMTSRASRDTSTCLGAIQVSVRLAPVQVSFSSASRPIGVTWRCFKAPIIARGSASFSGLELTIGHIRSVSFYSLFFLSRVDRYSIRLKRRVKILFSLVLKGFDQLRSILSTTQQTPSLPSAQRLLLDGFRSLRVY